MVITCSIKVWGGGWISACEMDDYVKRLTMNLLFVPPIFFNVIFYV